MASPIVSFIFLLTILSAAYLSFSIRIPLNPLAADVADVHDLLPEYGFPKGIIPDNVASYSVSEDGVFEIYFNNPCYVHFDQLVYYEKKVKGKLSHGRVTDVSGIQAKKLFLWVSVTGMQVEEGSDWVEFFVGSFSQKLPANQFDEIPECNSRACQQSHQQSM